MTEKNMILSLIQQQQSDGQQVVYIHGDSIDPTINERVDLSILIDGKTIDQDDDLYLKTTNPLTFNAWIHTLSDQYHRDQMLYKIIPWMMVLLALATTIVIPLSGSVIDPTLIFIVITIVDLILIIDPLVKPFHVDALSADHSQHLTIKIDGINETDQTKIITGLLDHDPTIQYRWNDHMTLQLDTRSDLSRYTICQWIRSNGYAPRLIHTKNGK